MTHSLNALAESLAERANRQFDIPFREQIKLWIGAWRSTLMRQSLERTPQDRPYFITSLEIELEEVSPSHLIPSIGCTVLRTKCRLPDPLRSNGILFDYVGSVDMMESYPVVPPHSILYLNTSKYTGRNAKAVWIDNYLYLYNNPLMKAIRVHTIFDNLEELNKSCGYSPGQVDKKKCVDHDAPYPVSLDIQQRIVQSILGTEMRRYIEEPNTEIKLDNENNGKQR